MKAVLIGNYGVGNVGDEALRAYFLRVFPNVAWQVVSARPTQNELPRLPMGPRSFFRTDWRRTITAIKSADAVVFGGGTLFTDAESLLACFIWGLHAFIAFTHKRPVFLAFQGVGPFRTVIGEGIARFVFRQATFISVRDRKSLERVQGWKVSTKIIHTFDPVILSFISQKIDDNTKNVFTIIPRRNPSNLFWQQVEMTPISPSLSVEVVLLQPEDPEEQKVSRMIVERIARATVRPVHSTEELMMFLSHSAHCLTERFHGALAALAAGVPTTVVSQAAGDKLDEARKLAEEGSMAAAVTLAEDGERALRDALGH